VEIRTLTEADAASYWALRLRALRDEPASFGRAYEDERDRPLTAISERFRNEWHSPENFVLGAVVDGLVGTVGLVRHQGRKERHKADIWGVYVVPEARGQGIGRALMLEVIARAKALPGLEQINLGVTTSNAAARALYSSLWFNTYGLERHALKVDGRYVDEEYMVLWLERQT